MGSMRDIKFRAWYKGEEYPMFEGSLEEDEKPRMIYNIQDIYDGSGADDSGNGVGHIGCFGSFLDDEDYIVEQYTGLKDKNGTKIYEGDIVTSASPELIFQVVYKPPSFCRKWIDDVSKRYHDSIEPMAWNTHIICEVIGNIHEHKYLLEE